MYTRKKLIEVLEKEFSLSKKIDDGLCSTYSVFKDGFARPNANHACHAGLYANLGAKDNFSQIFLHLGPYNKESSLTSAELKEFYSWLFYKSFMRKWYVRPSSLHEVMEHGVQIRTDISYDEGANAAVTTRYAYEWSSCIRAFLEAKRVINPTYAWFVAQMFKNSIRVGVKVNDAHASVHYYTLLKAIKDAERGVFTPRNKKIINKELNSYHSISYVFNVDTRSPKTGVLGGVCEILKEKHGNEARSDWGEKIYKFEEKNRIALYKEFEEIMNKV